MTQKEHTGSLLVTLWSRGEVQAWHPKYQRERSLTKCVVRNNLFLVIVQAGNLVQVKILFKHNGKWFIFAVSNKAILRKFMNNSLWSFEP